MPSHALVGAPNRGALAKVQARERKRRGAQSRSVRKSIGDRDDDHADDHSDSERQELLLGPLGVHAHYAPGAREGLPQQIHAHQEHLGDRHDSHKDPEVAAVVTECPVQQFTQAQRT